jgi:hypothetical protein
MDERLIRNEFFSRWGCYRGTTLRRLAFVRPVQLPFALLASSNFAQFDRETDGRQRNAWSLTRCQDTPWNVPRKSIATRLRKPIGGDDDKAGRFYLIV